MHDLDRAELRRLPVRRGAREYALLLVERAAQAAQRLHDPTDAEALHDFRVSVRRLRSFQRAFADDLPFGRKLVRRLRRLARSTNRPRDLEVGLAWLATQRAGLRGRQRVGYDWLVDRLRRESDETYRWVRASVPLRWMKLECRLRRALQEPFSDELRAPGFGEVSASRILGFAEELESSLSAVGSIDDERPAHQARICAKRVRYLLDPFRGTVEGAKPAHRLLTEFQDLFGELNDTHVQLGRLRHAVRDAAAERAERLLDLALERAEDSPAARSLRARDERSGLIELARRVLRRRQALFARAQETFLGGGAEAMIAEVRAVAARLAGEGTVIGHGETDGPAPASGESA